MDATQTYETIKIEQDGDGITWLYLNRPEKRNAMNPRLHEEMVQALDELSRDDETRVLVLTGAGSAFCAGMDIKEHFRELGDDRPEFERVEELSQRWRWRQLSTFPKPTIAMVNGHAVGAGLSLALACDIRIASEQAKLGTVFRNVGFSGDFGGSYFLQRLVGIGKARELYFTGEILTADAAGNIGMVNRVVPHDRLEPETMALAGQLASGPTLAYARMKENLNLFKSVRNAPKYKFLPVEGANVYDILRHQTLLLTKDAAQALQGVLA